MSGLLAFLLGSVLGSTHTVEKRTVYNTEYKCPLIKDFVVPKVKKPSVRVVISTIPRFKSKEDIEEYFIGKPINEETMDELKAVLKEYDRRKQENN